MSAPSFDPSKLLAESNVPLVTQAHVNVGQELLVITEDKVKLCLIEQINAAKAKNAWHTPFSILCAVLLAFTTATFDKDWIVPRHTWRAVFLLMGVWSAVWTAKAIYHAVRAPDAEKLIERIIVDLKRQTQSLAAPAPPTKSASPAPQPSTKLTP